MMFYCPLCNIFTRLWMNLKLAVRGKWEKKTNYLRSQKCKKQYIYIVIPKLRKHNELHINSSLLHWKNKSILTVCHNFEWRKYFKLHYFLVTYQNLMAHVMGITILYIKCIYRHHSINSMDDDSNWCLHTNKKKCNFKNLRNISIFMRVCTI